MLNGRQWPGGVEVRVRMGLHTGEGRLAVQIMSDWMCIGLRGFPRPVTEARCLSRTLPGLWLRRIFQMEWVYGTWGSTDSRTSSIRFGSFSWRWTAFPTGSRRSGRWRVQRDFDRGVAEPVLNDLRVFALGDEHCRMRVPKIMNSIIGPRFFVRQPDQADCAREQIAALLPTAFTYRRARAGPPRQPTG